MKVNYNPNKPIKITSITAKPDSIKVELAPPPAANPNQPQPFAYHDKGSLATSGRSSAVGEINGTKLTGRAAWLAWLGIHLLFLVGFRNKISVLMQWSYSYFTYKRGARIITGVSSEKSAGSA